MDKQQTAAFIFSQSVACLCELEAMKAANREREFQGLAPAYGEDQFRGLFDRFTIDYNDVLGYFNRANYYG